MSDTTINLYRGSPRQVLYWVKRALRAGAIPFIQGSPGIGKSAMLRALAKELNLKLIDDRVSTNGPEHYQGLPDVAGEKAVYKPFDVFPLDTDDLPVDENGKKMNGWLFFLDEFNSGLPTTLVGAYKFLMEREVAGKKVHPACHIVAAGNRDEDRAITQSLGTALQRRFAWYEMYIDGTEKSHFDAFMMDVAMPQGWNSKVIGFLNYKPGYLNVFDPAHTEKTFRCPATWNVASNFANDGDAYGEPIVLDDVPLYAGVLGTTGGMEFVNWCLLFSNIPTLDKILADPRMVDVPTNSGEQWAVISMLIENATKVNLDDIEVYVDKFGLEFKILFWRSIQLKDASFHSEAAFRRAQTGLARYLYGA